MGVLENLFTMGAGLIGRGIGALINLAPSFVKTAVKAVTGIMAKGYNAVSHWAEGVPLVGILYNAAKFVPGVGDFLEGVELAGKMGTGIYESLATEAERNELSRMTIDRFAEDVFNVRHASNPRVTPLNFKYPTGPPQPPPTPQPDLVGDSVSYPLPSGGFLNPPPSQRVGPSAVM